MDDILSSQKLFVGIGGIVLGIIVMLVAIPFHRDFFRRRPELPGPDGRAIGGTITPEDDIIGPAVATP